LAKRHRRGKALAPGYRTQVGIADVWDVDDPVTIPANLPSSVKRDDYVEGVRSLRKAEYLGNLFLRILVESIGLYQFCGNDDCRRAGGCCSRRVECWEQHNDLVRATVLPGFREALREASERDALEGGIEPDADPTKWDPRRLAVRFRAIQAKRTRTPLPDR
jgi:hypothetical protein